MAVLKLKKDNESREIEFELDYLLTLTIQQRFQMMLKKTKEMKKLQGKNGNRRVTKIIKRT